MVLPLSRHVTLGKLYNFSESQFPHLEHEELLSQDYYEDRVRQPRERAAHTPGMSASAPRPRSLVSPGCAHAVASVSLPCPLLCRLTSYHSSQPSHKNPFLASQIPKYITLCGIINWCLLYYTGFILHINFILHSTGVSYTGGSPPTSRL